jgi:hypothetical protein
MKSIVATSRHQLNEITDWVHDRFFEIDALRFDRESCRVEIPITVLILDETKKPRKYRVQEAKLIIKHAAEPVVDDQTHTGESFINTLDYKDDALIVNCATPVYLSIPVKSLDVTLVILDRTVKYVSLFRGDYLRS